MKIKPPSLGPRALLLGFVWEVFSRRCCSAGWKISLGSLKSGRGRIGSEPRSSFACLGVWSCGASVGCFVCVPATGLCGFAEPGWDNSGSLSRRDSPDCFCPRPCFPALDWLGAGDMLACVSVAGRGRVTALVFFPRLCGSASVGGGLGFLGVLTSDKMGVLTSGKPII